MKFFSLSRSGFTIIELIVAMSIIAIITMMSIPYLFGTKDKAYLAKETEIFVGVLNSVRQESITASQGLAHSVMILPAENKYLEVVSSEEHDLGAGVTFTHPTFPTEITFSKLRGQVNSPVFIELNYKSYTSTVSILTTGIIESSVPERK